MTAVQATAALMVAINNPNRAAPLWGLAYIKYPGRELQPHTLPDGTIQVILKKWGFQYKAKKPRPKNPPPVNTAAIHTALNTALAPRFKVRAVTDQETFIQIELEEKHNV